MHGFPPMTEGLWVIRSICMSGLLSSASRVRSSHLFRLNCIVNAPRTIRRAPPSRMVAARARRQSAPAASSFLRPHFVRRRRLLARCQFQLVFADGQRGALAPAIEFDDLVDVRILNLALFVI